MSTKKCDAKKNRERVPRRYQRKKQKKQNCQSIFFDSEQTLSFANKSTIQARLGIKAMRLEKNFGLSTFPVFRVSRYFEVRNKFGIVTLVLNVRKFRKTYQKFSQKSLPKINPENYTGIFVICQKYTVIFKKSTVSAKNSGTFLTFLTYVFEISLIIDKIGPKKWSKIPKIIPEFLTSYQK